MARAPVTALLAVLLAAAVAHAAPPETRVVLADDDPELFRAVEAALAPWHLEVVVDPPPPATTGDAELRAREREARFVVWRQDGDLVVFDRSRGAAEHREGAEGALDPAAATAAALTVKTLMRLPPPGETELPAPAPTGRELRIQSELATRVASGSTTEIGARAAGAVLVRPWRARGWRFGLAGDLGTDADVDGGGFKGSWRDWALLAVATWTQARGAIELEPRIAIGVARSSLSGAEAGVLREETATLGALRIGAAVRWRFGSWTAGAAAELQGNLGTETYIKRMGNGDLFRIPGFALWIGGVAAIDFGT